MNFLKKTVLVIFIAAFLVSIVAFGFVGCHNGKDDYMSEIRIAYLPNITDSQALVMKSQKTLEKKLGNDIAVKWTSFNAGPSELEALFAGKIDIGYIGPVPAICGYIKSSGDLRIIAGVSNGGSVLVARKDIAIKSAVDLAGKTVAIPELGNTQHLILLGLLSANGLAPTTRGGNVTVVASSNGDIISLMNRKNIDAALVPEPWGSIMELTGNAKIVFDYDNLNTNGIPSSAVVIVSKDFLHNHRDIVEKFMEAHKQATAYINENFETSKSIVSNQISAVTHQTIDNTILNSAFKRMKITYDIPVSSIRDLAQLSLNENFITKLPDDDLMDDTFVK